MQNDAQTSAGPLFSPTGCIPKATYILRMLVLVVIMVGAIWMVMSGFNLMIWVVIIVTFFMVLAQAAKRTRDCGVSGWFSLVVLVPGLGQIALIALAVIPSRTFRKNFGITFND